MDVRIRFLGDEQRPYYKEIEDGTSGHPLSSFECDSGSRTAIERRPRRYSIDVQSFIEEIAAEYGMPNLGIDDDAMLELQKLDWTGNVRELHNVMERLAILSNGNISAQDVLDYAVPRKKKQPKNNNMYHDFDKFQNFKDHVEKQFILNKLEQNGWNISKTAETLDIQRSHLYNKMEKYGIRRDN
ncbi:MAG: helix-turn-helix domain-containing protein [Bacteroidia bacterium]